MDREKATLMSTTPPEAQHDGAQDRISAAVTALQGDLVRSEGKASLLLALSGAALVALVSTVPNLRPPLPAGVLGGLGTAALLAARGCCYSQSVRTSVEPAGPAGPG